MRRVVALDLSLTSTGVADSADPGRPFCITPPKGLGGPERLYWILQRVMAATAEADLTVIEGYSHASKYQTHQMGELGGVVRLALWTRGRPYVELAPSARCKVATGKGNAAKADVLAEAIRRLGYEGSSDDEADARWLLEAALQHYGLPGAASLPAGHTEWLDRYDWPEILEEVPA